MNESLQHNFRAKNQEYVSKKKKKRSPIPLYILLGVFVICLVLYGCQFFGQHTNTPGPASSVETNTDPVTEPETTEPETTEPETTEPETTEPTPPAPVSKYTVILDPGHGFGDGGCSSDLLNGYNEKDLTMNIVNLIKASLEKQGVKVILTHDGQTFKKNSELDQMAKSAVFSMESYVRNLAKNYGKDKNDNPVDVESVWKAFKNQLIDTGTGANLFNVYERAYYSCILSQMEKVDAFVSIHVNSTSDTEHLEKYKGYTISYCNSNENAAKSARLEKLIADQISKAFPLKKLVKYSDPWYDSFVITKYSGVPAVLIESGFATDTSDAADLLSDSWRQKWADTIALGIMTYLQAVNE
ncbi:MAG: N-acetylmuramoyl-L-alanine amidase [Clostridia bacterium]|nr:N-acetylmuramoyl-L-alanine amidase [Clostridia bacterium]